MKPEVIKSIVRSYLIENQHSSSYKGFRNISYASPECESGGPIQPFDGAYHDLFVMEAQGADLPLERPNVPLDPQMEELAAGIGRQLRQLSDQINLNDVAAVNQGFANGNRCIHFQEHIIRVPPTCDSVQIPVVRAGAADGMVNATWRTCDRSAKAGLHYVNSRGNISFTQNEKEKTIEVKIIRDQDRKTDMHFAIELFDDEGTFSSLKVFIVDDSKLCSKEKLVIRNIFCFACDSSRNPVSKIATFLSDYVTPNTFKVALQCVSSSADSVPKELALGAELLRLTLSHESLSTLTNVFCEYFSYLPELDELDKIEDKWDTMKTDREKHFILLTRI